MLLTQAQIALKAGLSRERVRQLHNAGSLPPPARERSGRFLWESSDIDEWILNRFDKSQRNTTLALEKIIFVKDPDISQEDLSAHLRIFTSSTDVDVVVLGIFKDQPAVRYSETLWLPDLVNRYLRDDTSFIYISYDPMLVENGKSPFTRIMFERDDSFHEMGYTQIDRVSLSEAAFRDIIKAGFDVFDYDVYTTSNIRSYLANHNEPMEISDDPLNLNLAIKHLKAVENVQALNVVKNDLISYIEKVNYEYYKRTKHATKSAITIKYPSLSQAFIDDYLYQPTIEEIEEYEAAHPFSMSDSNDFYYEHMDEIDNPPPLGELTMAQREAINFLLAKKNSVIPYFLPGLGLKVNSAKLPIVGAFDAKYLSQVTQTKLDEIPSGEVRLEELIKASQMPSTSSYGLDPQGSLVIWTDAEFAVEWPVDRWLNLKDEDMIVADASPHTHAAYVKHESGELELLPICPESGSTLSQAGFVPTFAWGYLGGNSITFAEAIGAAVDGRIDIKTLAPLRQFVANFPKEKAFEEKVGFFRELLGTTEDQLAETNPIARSINRYRTN